MECGFVRMASSVCFFYYIIMTKLKLKLALPLPLLPLTVLVHVEVTFISGNLRFETIIDELNIMLAR